MFRLETERLIIGIFLQDDWRDFLQLSRNPAVMQHISDGKIWDEEKTRAWVGRQEGCQQKYGFSRYKLTLKATGELAGFCGLGHFGDTGEVEIGWWIKESLWGKGLATEAAMAVKVHSLEVLGLDHLISVCTPENKASSRIMEKIGLRFREHSTAEAMGLPLGDLPLVVYAGS